MRNFSLIRPPNRLAVYGGLGEFRKNPAEPGWLLLNEAAPVDPRGLRRKTRTESELLGVQFARFLGVGGSMHCPPLAIVRPPN